MADKIKLVPARLSYPALKRPAVVEPEDYSATVTHWRWPDASFNYTDQAKRWWGEVEKELRRLLGMWVSELEPVLIFGPGVFLGVGTEEHGVILPAGRWKVREAANYEEDEKTAYDVAYVAGWKDRMAGQIAHRPEIGYLIDPWPNATGAGYSEGMWGAAAGRALK